MSSMKSLFEPSTADEVQQRLRSIQPESKRLWGKMTAPQMLAHCSIAMETAVGDTVLPRLLIGRLLGPLVKPQFTNDKPLSRNGPTAPGLIVSDERELSKERDRLAKLVDRFSKGGPDHCTTEPHCFFGKLTPQEWAKGMYKHIDHHLRQFGV
jgi:Protein of unknown function (DUF1569)